MERLLTIDGSGSDRTGTNRLRAVLRNNFNEYDQVIMLVNSTKYGGSGGEFSTSSVHNSGAELLRHELAHSLVGLIDEYWAGDGYATDRLNMTRASAETMRWRLWNGSANIGRFAHGTSGLSAQYFKPTTGGRCKMEVLNPRLCAVCTEFTIEKIYEMSDIFDDYYPQNLTGVQIADGSSLEFELYLLTPFPNTQRIRWTLNNQALPANTNNLAVVQISATQLTATGNNRLTATIQDTSSMLRGIGRNESLQTITWNITRGGGGVAILDNDNARARGVFVGISNQEIRLLLPSAANKADVALYDIKGRLLFRTDVNIKGSFASIALPKSVATNQAVILQVKTDTGFNKNKMVLVR